MVLTAVLIAVESAYSFGDDSIVIAQTRTISLRNSRNKTRWPIYHREDNIVNMTDREVSL